MIGLIFGETDFPKVILKKIKNKKKYLIIDLTKKKFYKKDKNSHSVSIGQFGKIIKILKDNHCRKVLFAGKVLKPNLAKLKLTDSDYNKSKELNERLGKLCNKFCDKSKIFKIKIENLLKK